ncbi:hypothetical protein [Clostridium thermobutyricum]|nr:hypothetical protein [Clostridium thermobutyricum]
MLYTACSRGIKEVYIFLNNKGKVENDKIAKILELEISDITIL